MDKLLTRKAELIVQRAAPWRETLLVEPAGDRACFPEDAVPMMRSFGAADTTYHRVRGRHLGVPVLKGEPAGSRLAAGAIDAWLADRFPLAV